MRFSTGIMVKALERGKVRARKPNQWSCRGDIMKPQAMNLVKRSKSKDGGRLFMLGIILWEGSEFVLSWPRSVIWIERNLSFCTKPGFLEDLNRTAVIVWATVSAMPLSTYSSVSIGSSCPYPPVYRVSNHDGEHYG